jgi:hypothetical protein
MEDFFLILFLTKEKKFISSGWINERCSFFYSLALFFVLKFFFSRAEIGLSHKQPDERKRKKETSFVRPSGEE